MRLALLAAATLWLHGCAASAPKSADSAPRSTGTPATAAATGVRMAELRPEAKYTLQRSGGERFGTLVRQSGHFSAPYLIAVSADRGNLHRFQASTGTYHDEIGQDRPADEMMAKPQALTTFGKELWLADSAGGRLQQFYGFDPRFIETLEHEALKSPLALLFTSGGKSGRLLFVLDRDGEQLRLHRFDTRILRATAPDQPNQADRPDRIQLETPQTVELGTMAGIPSLLHDTDGNRLILINGAQVKAWNPDLEEVPHPLGALAMQGTRIGAGLVSCPSSLDKGYWFIAEAGNAETTIHFVGYEKGEARASVKLTGLDWSAGFLFDRSNMALFPRGAIFAVEGGQRINGYAWDEITRAVGLRAHCF
jgi:hypothetical protein